MRKLLVGLVIVTGLIHVFFKTYVQAIDIQETYIQETYIQNSMKRFEISPMGNGGRIIIVSIPGLSFQEVEMSQKLSSWADLWENGSIAAMNVRTPKVGIEDSYASIGAGAPALAKIRDQGFMIDEMIGEQTARKLHERYMGPIKDRKGKIVVFTIADLLKLNERQHQSAIPGLLGERLQQAGVKRYVFGNRDLTMEETNGDTTTLYRRHAPLMLVDLRGFIDGGLVDASLLQADPLRPFGVRTDYERLLQSMAFVLNINHATNSEMDYRVDHATEPEEFDRETEYEVDQEIGYDVDHKSEHEEVIRETKQEAVLPNKQVILIELGDLDRLYAEKELYDRKRFQKIKSEIIEEIGIFLQQLHNRIDHDVLWVFSPLTHTQARSDKSLLTPFLAFDGRLPSGWLFSETTRRAGLISYTDLAPTILHYYGLDVPETMRGSPFDTVITDKSVEELMTVLYKMENIYKLRPKFSYPYVTIQVIILIVGLAYAMFRFRSGWEWLRIALYSVILAPILLLIIGKGAGWPARFLILFFCITIIFSSWYCSRLRDLNALFVIGAITSLLILLDGWFGADAMKGSILGYDPMIGARYYGIGNEYMGVLIGAVILALSAWQQRTESDRYVRWGVSFAIFIPVLIFLASPMWGANAGGALTAAAAFVSYMWLAEQTIRGWGNFRFIKMLWTVAISLLIGFGCLWLLNATPLGAMKSHVGKAFDYLMAGEFSLIWAIILRKLAMNMHLLGVSSWGKLFIVGFFVIIAMLIIMRSERYWKWKQKYPLLVSGFTANVIGATIAFLTNDSGIVAAATMILYAAVPALIISYNSDSHSA